jgi:hypothetical protein
MLVERGGELACTISPMSAARRCACGHSRQPQIHADDRYGWRLFGRRQRICPPPMVGTKGLLRRGHGSCATGTNHASVPKTIFGFKSVFSVGAAGITAAIERPQCFLGAGAVLCTTSHETDSFVRILLPNERGNTWHTGENHIHQRRNSIPS